MGNSLSCLKKSVETQSIYNFFRKCFILLRKPPLKLNIKQTKELLLTVTDDDTQAEELLHEIHKLLKIKQNYNNFASNSFIAELLEKFVNSEANENNLTIGHMAALADDTFMIGKLLTYEIIPNFPSVTDSTGKTALHHASESGRTKVIDQFLNIKKPVIAKFIDLQDESGQTSLHLAAFDNKKGAVSRLIKKGASFDIEDDDGYKPIHIALLRKLTPMVELLESEGADIHEPINGKPLAAIAYEEGDTQLVNYLLNLKIDISHIYDGTTFLHEICANKNIRLLKKVIKQYDEYFEEDLDSSEPNIYNQENMEGQTPFIIACANEFYAGMRELSSIGAEVDYILGGTTALHQSCADGNYKMVRTLLELGADPSILNHERLNCFQVALETRCDLAELIDEYMPLQPEETKAFASVELSGFSDEYEAEA